MSPEETLSPPTSASHYPGNRPPLCSTRFLKLPLGSIRPEGWLRRQLVLMAGGFTGRLGEISPELQFEGNAWVAPDGRGENGWEELPYWLRGFVALGHLLDDEPILVEAHRWIDGILASQQEDGWFGPAANRDPLDLWPNMLALHAFRWHHEATGDPRVLPFMLRYFLWQLTVPLHLLLPDSWQKWRGGDSLDSIYWLYDRTGQGWLLDLARINHERTADWVGGIPTWHGVNLCQGFREPGQYWQQTGDRRYVASTERNYASFMDHYGQVPGGMFGADENCRPGSTGPRQAAETCSMAEMMFSSEMLVRITGDAVWADRCEDVAFNSLPASMTADLTALRYLTAPNQVQSDRADKSPLIDNGGPMFAFNPHDHRCCRHNVGFAWPGFAESLWMATPDGGLAAVLYAPNRVRALVGDGVEIAIAEDTDYPFEETVRLTVETPEEIRFPLVLRVPDWCGSPELQVNGVPLDVAPDNGWLRVERVWSDGDRVMLHLPMDVRVTEWTHNRGTVSVSRGPLTYSLRIGERWEQFGTDETWSAYETFPTTPWNYGLVLDETSNGESIRVIRTSDRLAPNVQPFTPMGSPVTLRARARRIPGWQLESNGLVGEVQAGPIRSGEPDEEVELIPMGCARLRISAFPRISDGPDAREWNAG